MRKRRLASRNEMAAHQIIQKTLADTQWNVFGNVSVQQVLEKDERLSPAEFDLYTRGSLDFVVFDTNYDPLLAVELDGFGHEDSRQVVRDLIKNALCARAGLPLLRIGADDLREREETTVLEWLCAATVSFERDVDADLDDENQDEPIDVDPVDGPSEGDDYPGPELGEPGAEMEHPFPDNALIATRLMQRYGIGIGELSPLIAFSGTLYVLELRWPPAFQPPRFRLGRVSEYVVSEVGFAVAKLEQPGNVLFSGLGRAEFAWAHKLPATVGGDESLTPIDFPWDPLGVSRQLAEFDALRKVDHWARSTDLFATAR